MTTSTRWTAAHVKDAAKRFASSSAAEHWNLFAAPIRCVLIDASVMDEVRAANSANSPVTFTASELMEFRRMLVEELAAGVKVGRSEAVRFAIYE